MLTNANYFVMFSKLLGFTKDSKVSFDTSQKQILQMYKQGEKIPWDVEAAQPALEKAEQDGLIKGVVLDAGCGFGDNAIYLAQKGYECVGFDFSPEAISIARQRAADAKVASRCQFVVADALNVAYSPLADRVFDTILDSACLQCFDPATQAKYVENMASLLKSNGAFVLLVVCNQSQLRSWCRGVDWMKAHVRSIFTRDTGWYIKSLVETKFIENIPSVTIKGGERTFSPTTLSPCLLMVASHTKPGGLGMSSLLGLGAIAALATIAAVSFRRAR
mmetsp:Transcript_49140/g.100291  ORF Transcript_49140/g.100291 Transcript_49140/m.100291 type:complete len:276 (-) Transcript_49140:291-1118(-)